MSHVSAMKVKVKNLAALKVAAEELGLQFVEGQTKFKWYGQWQDDWHGKNAAFRSGVNPKDYGTCAHAIRDPNNSKAYEVGVIDMKDGSHVLAWDNWQGGYGLAEKIGSNCEKLQQSYAKQCVILDAQKKGYQVQRVETLEKGGIRVHLQERV